MGQTDRCTDGQTNRHTKQAWLLRAIHTLHQHPQPLSAWTAPTTNDTWHNNRCTAGLSPLSPTPMQNNLCAPFSCHLLACLAYLATLAHNSVAPYNSRKIFCYFFIYIFFFLLNFTHTLLRELLIPLLMLLSMFLFGSVVRLFSLVIVRLSLLESKYFNLELITRTARCHIRGVAIDLWRHIKIVFPHLPND